MKWDVFRSRKGGSKGDIEEKIDGLIRDIEKFAPRKFREERFLHYYNYKIVARYLESLLSVLRIVSQRKRWGEDQAVFAQELFLSLKDFYDPKDELSVQEAIQDRNLKKRFVDLVRLFYGRKDINMEQLNSWLAELRDA